MKTLEEKLFYRIRSLCLRGKDLTSNYHIYNISDQECEGYRCDNLQLGSFEIRKFPDTEILDEFGCVCYYESAPDYQYCGYVHGQKNVVKIEEAFEIIK